MMDFMTRGDVGTVGWSNYISYLAENSRPRMSYFLFLFLGRTQSMGLHIYDINDEWKKLDLNVPRKCQ